MIVSIVSSDKIACTLSELIAQTVLKPGRYAGIADFEEDGGSLRRRLSGLYWCFQGLFLKAGKWRRRTAGRNAEACQTLTKAA